MARIGVFYTGLSMVLVFAVLASVAVVALPGSTACLLLAGARLQQDPQEIVVLPDSGTGQQTAYHQLVMEGQRRISETFGRPQAKPMVVFFNRAKTFWPLRLNPYGQTATLGSKACLLIGPYGQNLDVVAHELMHAELHHRVGFWKKFREIPAWFDEGVAMQVDFRRKYDTKAEHLLDSSYVRESVSYRSFAQGANPYTAAKKEVQELLAELDRHSLYERLALIRNGEPFESAMR